MDWKAKAYIQRAFSAAPGGHRLNYLMQRFVTRTLPQSTETLKVTADTAKRHLEAIAAYNSKPISEMRFFEFGAGYDLSEPIAAAGLGVKQRVLYDIRPIARPAMIRSAATGLRELGLLLPEFRDEWSIQESLASIGLRYVAPGDARATGLEVGSIDACTTTSVLEHISAPDLEAILTELRRILARGGVCSFAIDYHDHFARTDPGINGLHFLRFEEKDWKKWNCALQYQNRLRHEDYVEMFERAGFALSHVEPVPDPKLPKDPVTAARFRGRTDLGIGDGWFVLTNP